MNVVPQEKNKDACEMNLLSVNKQYTRCTTLGSTRCRICPIFSQQFQYLSIWRDSFMNAVLHIRDNNLTLEMKNVPIIKLYTRKCRISRFVQCVKSLSKLPSVGLGPVRYIANQCIYFMCSCHILLFHDKCQCSTKIMTQP